MMEQEIQRVLEEEIQPMLAMHLGRVEFAGYENGVVSVKMEGACKGCPLSQLTLKGGIETMLKERIHGITRVDAVE